ncbi:MAG: hypothetical protein IPM98_14900 [Lewinellaceae bacterium]|nr:hypothetical protein [Lewinellaceae bacterium]
MKQKQLFKYVIAGILAFSLFSAIYVNLDAAAQPECAKTASDIQQATEAVIVEEENQDRNLPIPDVTLISRILDLAQRVVSHTP